jgi:hypothetical protein
MKKIIAVSVGAVPLFAALEALLHIAHGFTQPPYTRACQPLCVYIIYNAFDHELHSTRKLSGFHVNSEHQEMDRES